MWMKIYMHVAVGWKWSMTEAKNSMLYASLDKYLLMRKRRRLNQLLLCVRARLRSMPPFEETRLTMSNHANTDTKHYSLFYLHGFNGALLFPHHFTSSRFLQRIFTCRLFRQEKQNLKMVKQQSVVDKLLKWVKSSWLINRTLFAYPLLCLRETLACVSLSLPFFIARLCRPLIDWNKESDHRNVKYETWTFLNKIKKFLH